MTALPGGTQVARPRQSSWFFVRISLFWLGLSFMWGALNIQIIPDRVPKLVGTEFQGTAIGLIFFVGLGIAIVVQPLAGALSDRSRVRWGRRRTFMLVGVLTALPFLILVGLSPNYWLLFGAIVCLQIAANTAHGPYQGVIPDQVNPDARGRASGFFGIANQLGTLLGAGIASVFLSQGLLLPAVLAIVGVLALTAVGAWRFVPDSPAPAPEPFAGVRVELRQRLRELARRPAFAWLVLGRLFFFMGLLAMDNFLKLYIQNGLKEPDHEIKTTGVLAVVIGVAAISSVLGGWIADRFGRLRLVAIAAALGVASGLLMLSSQTYGQMLVYGVILGLGLGLFTAADWAMAIDLVPDPRSPGLYMGLTNLATAGGDALATLTAGIALDAFNRVQEGLGYRAPFGMMAVWFFLALLIVPVIRARMGRTGPRPTSALA
ncbi:MAG: MFS transporter [Actinobacteria bacterium]|nr:MFS transporter [Actinomycetota bacterium]